MEQAFERFSERLKHSFNQNGIVGITLSSPRNGEVLKIKGKVILLSGNKVFQFEEQLSEGRLRHQNLSIEETLEYLCKQLTVFSHLNFRHSSGGSSEILVSKHGKMTYLEDARLKTVPMVGNQSSVREILKNNREKNRLLTGDEPFLKLLGISDASGRVHDKKQGKFRQICRFCEFVQDILPKLPQNGPVRVSDLCSGKSYLSFAVYHFLSEIKKREVIMTCVDLKQSVMDECRTIAEQLHFDGMSFFTMDINEFCPDEKQHLVISLHACDFATDIVLKHAAKMRADVILSTPCCQRQLKGKIASEPLSFATKYGILSDKICASLTDALRLSYMNAFGYETAAVEFIDPEDTPKNTMLRCVRTFEPRLQPDKALKLANEYREAYRFLTGTQDESFEEQFQTFMM